MTNNSDANEKDEWDLLKEAAEKNSEKYRLIAEDFDREWQLSQKQSRNNQRGCRCCCCKCNIKYQ